MRHVFFVHSYITLLCAMSIIKLKSLSVEEVYLIFARDFQHATPYSSCRFPFPVYPSGHFKPSFKWRKQARARLLELDKFIESISGGRNIYWYFPHCSFDFFYLILSNKYSEAFYILEEGDLSYSPTQGEIDTRVTLLELFEMRKTRRWIEQALSYGSRSLVIKYPYFHSSPRGYYAFSPYAFPWTSNKEVLNLEGAIMDLFSDHSLFSDFDNQHIIVFDGLVKYKKVSEDVYYSSLTEVIHSLHTQGVSEFYFKAHPSDSGGSSKNIEFINRMSIRFPEAVF